MHAGLRLPGHVMEELVAVAPWALAMARRLRRDHPREAETASIFDPGRDVDGIPNLVRSFCSGQQNELLKSCRPRALDGLRRGSQLTNLIYSVRTLRCVGDDSWEDQSANAPEHFRWPPESRRNRRSAEVGRFVPWADIGQRMWGSFPMAGSGSSDLHH